MDIEKTVNEAVKIRESGYNCAQAVLCACRDYTGLDDKLALMVAGPFGGGISCGELCGSICGAAIAVSMVYPYVDNTQPTDKAALSKKTREIVNVFNEKYGCSRCRDLKANRIDCSELVALGAETAVKIIEENKLK